MANSRAQSVEGLYNLPDTGYISTNKLGKYIHIAGNGQGINENFKSIRFIDESSIGINVRGQSISIKPYDGDTTNPYIVMTTTTTGNDFSAAGNGFAKCVVYGEDWGFYVAAYRKENNSIQNSIFLYTGDTIPRFLINGTYENVTYNIDFSALTLLSDIWYSLNYSYWGKMPNDRDYFVSQTTQSEDDYAWISTWLSNAHTLDWNGLGWFRGGLKVGGESQEDSSAKEVATTEYVDTSIAAIASAGSGSGNIVAGELPRNSDTTSSVNLGSNVKAVIVSCNRAIEIESSEDITAATQLVMTPIILPGKTEQYLWYKSGSTDAKRWQKATLSTTGVLSIPAGCWGITYVAFY